MSYSNKNAGYESATAGRRSIEQKSGFKLLEARIAAGLPPRLSRVRLGDGPLTDPHLEDWRELTRREARNALATLQRMLDQPSRFGFARIKRAKRNADRAVTVAKRLAE